ncbi:MAG: leucine--tRNA ligase, partial [Balneolales bacterium]
KKQITAFTTRPDTLFGATYMVLAPELPLVDEITVPEQRSEVKQYREEAALKSDLDRTDLNKNKTGVFTGAYAINPATGKEIPIWIADYVLAGYGTGSIMAVPGHDQRDWDFATKYNLPVVEVVDGGDISKQAFTDTYAGVVINSGNEEFSINGLPVDKAKYRIIGWLEQKGMGKKTITYKLRDWLFSRQRYWGEPFPIIYSGNKSKALPDEELPVKLPDIDKFQPAKTGESPLFDVPEWVHTTDPETGLPARRETNTMPQWAGSCWYYLRFIDPQYEKGPVDPEKEKYWMPVDLYVGGAEHAVLHLLYARFWHKVLFDLGVVSTNEPFRRLINQGMILGELEFTALRDEYGHFVSTDGLKPEQRTDYEPVSMPENEVEKKGDHFVIKGTGTVVDARSYKMSKSRGNVINPDKVIDLYGADALRLYEMFMGPLEQVKPWSMRGVEGVYRFLKRVWRLMVDFDTDRLNADVADVEPTRDQLRTLHETIKKVTEDIDENRFNTAISALMIFNNEAMKWDKKPMGILKDFMLLLSPFAPHLAEELWQRLGEKNTLAYESWPSYEEKYLIAESHTYAIQVNGKVRSSIDVPAERATDKDYVLGMAKQDENIKRYLGNGSLVKEIFVPKRIVNLVVK